MANEFIEFLNFIEETTARYPDELADSFQDIFIYVPKGKTPPKPNKIPGRRTICMNSYFSKRNEDFSRVIYNEGWNQLEDHLGSELLRFCLTECMFAKRTKTGGFMVSNLSNLRNKITVETPQRLNKIFYKTVICYKDNPNSAHNRNRALVSNIDKPQLWSELKKTLHHLFCSPDMEISTDDMLFKISRTHKFPDTHILVKKNTRKTMVSQVIKMQVGKCKIVDYEKCMEPLELILKRLKKFHNKYNYEKALNRLVVKMTGNCGDKSEDHQNQGNRLSLPVLQMFFANICDCVIPTELFGSNKNINTVVKIICDLLEVPRLQSISLKPYILKMKISDLRWLEGVANSDTKWTLLGKLLKWLFNKFILEIFRTQLYVMVTNSSEKIYFKQKDWQKLTAQFLRKMCEDKVIVNINGLNTKVSCDGRWILFPKKDGVRPIISRISGSQQREITKIALCYLQQLYITKYGKSGKQIFVEKWKNLVDKFRNGQCKTMYLVCCDIQCAYECIDQKKLMEIVESFADSNGPKLTLKYYKIARDLKAVKSECFKLKECIKYPELELSIASKSIFACGSEKIVMVSKQALLHEIKQNVLNQNILISNQRYLLQDGIAQGAVLSSVLCDMYYAHMEEAYLSQFKQEGFLYRYVDDILFATEDRDSADRFLQLVNEGFPEYNCSFNTTKTRTNLPDHEHTVENIPFLGFNINPTTLEVTPEYSKSPRYSMVLSKPRCKLLQTFQKRLSNLASLKLDGIVLDCKINSEDTIIRNITCIFMRQAERCLWLLKALFEDIPSRLSKFFRIIELTNRQILRRVQRYFIANGFDFEKLVPRLAVIPWKSYRQVFGKMPILHVHFRSLFIKSIKMNERVAARR